MERKRLDVFTKVSFYIALFTLIILPISLYLASTTSNESARALLGFFVVLSILASVFAIPLSIVSLFSKEKLTKRIFALIANFSPSVIIVYGLMIEFADEFFRNAP